MRENCLYDDTVLFTLINPNVKIFINCLLHLDDIFIECKRYTDIYMFELYYEILIFICTLMPIAGDPIPVSAVPNVA